MFFTFYLILSYFVSFIWILFKSFRIVNVVFSLNTSEEPVVSFLPSFIMIHLYFISFILIFSQSLRIINNSSLIFSFLIHEKSQFFVSIHQIICSNNSYIVDTTTTVCLFITNKLLIWSFDTFRAREWKVNKNHFQFYRARVDLRARFVRAPDCPRQYECAGMKECARLCAAVFFCARKIFRDLAILSRVG